MLNRIEIIKEKTLVGKKLMMSLTKDQTAKLWKSFMQERSEIEHRVNSDFISLQNYPADYFASFDPNTEFEKWACVEVSSCDSLPKGMELFQLKAGKYAVFTHKGSSSDSRIFEFIFKEWLPSSDYLLDRRPHFEVLGEKYKNNDANSEEEIWIPILPKKS
jgi:AraC family transcriptional regulator